MSRSVDETRRDFLLKLAKTAAFVPPAVLSLDVRPGRAAPQGQGKGQGSQQASQQAQQQTSATGQGQQQSATGTLTPTSSAAQAPTRLDAEAQESNVPWSPGSGGITPPWSRPPPTQTGG